MITGKRAAAIQALAAKRAEEAGAGETIALGAGFPSAAHSINVMAMGTRAASSLRGECPGFIGSHPTVRLHWSGDTSELTIFASGEENTTLLIKDPSGDYHCNEGGANGRTVDPVVRLSHPGEGSYAIWVGRYDIGATADTRLHFSERGVLFPVAVEK